MSFIGCLCVKWFEGHILCSALAAKCWNSIMGRNNNNINDKNRCKKRIVTLNYLILVRQKLVLRRKCE